MKTCYLNLKKSIHRLQLLCLVGCFIIPIGCQSQSSKKPVEKSTAKTDQEWKAQLTPLQYYVLRQKGTEKPGNNPYNKFFKEGTYHCAACDKLLYRSEYKYDSGSGWPAFDRGESQNLAYERDHSLGMERLEVHCKNCGGHLGHVFDDGPRKTTGKRHCVNSAALKFKPKTNG